MPWKSLATIFFIGWFTSFTLFCYVRVLSSSKRKPASLKMVATTSRASVYFINHDNSGCRNLNQLFNLFFQECCHIGSFLKEHNLYHTTTKHQQALPKVLLSIFSKQYHSILVIIIYFPSFISEFAIILQIGHGDSKVKQNEAILYVSLTSNHPQLVFSDLSCLAKILHSILYKETCKPRKKNWPYFPLYWLFNRDLYYSLL